MHIPIRTRILLLFVGITLIQAVLLGTFFFSQDSRSLHTQINNQLKIITAAISKESKSLVVALSATERNDTINANLLQKIIDRISCPSGQNIFILNPQGTVLAQKIQNRSGHLSFPAGHNWNGEALIDGTDVIIASSSLHLNGQQLTVVGAADKQTVLPPSSQTFYFFIFLVVFLLLFSLLVGWTTNRYLISPLQRLAGSSATPQQKNNASFALLNEEELRDLAQTLDTKNKQLQESNRSLEQEIRHRHQEEKKAIQERIDAENSSKAKSIFLANMSHEIRTPLHGMIGLINMLNKGPLNTEQKKLLTMASVSGQRLQTLVNSILDLSQIESGKFQLQHSTFTLSSLITEVTELMQVQAKEKNLVLKASQDADIPDILRGDSGRIRQVLINLLNNSIKHTNQGGIDLTIRLESIPNDKEVVLLFTIEDSGSGISDEIQQTIFNPFEQGKIDPGKVTEGVGLGLAISDEFVHHMQGRIWLEKSDKNGSIFCFTIRCEKAAAPIPEARKEPEYPKKKLASIRILLAEDEFINQRVVSAYLEELGATVGICENGQELLERMDREKPDIILMDIRMPVLDGIEATKIIREKEARNNLPHIPIIALTAQATTTFETICKEAGMDHYITKPIPFDDLTRIICELHENAETHSSIGVS